MSHNYMVRCKCGQETERWNHAEDNLIQAVKDSYPLYLLHKTKWDVHYSQEINGMGYSGLAEFLARHWDHGGFEVVGEYKSDVPKPVRPDAPPHVYEQVCTERLRKELDDLLGRAQALRNGLNPEEEAEAISKGAMLLVATDIWEQLQALPPSALKMLKATAIQHEPLLPSGQILAMHEPWLPTLYNFLNCYRADPRTIEDADEAMGHDWEEEHQH